MDKTVRPDFDSYILEVCVAVSRRSTCRHRDQGAVVVKDRRIISTGYNGAPSGSPHCLASFCAKDLGEPCRAEGLHGESNAIISAAKAGVSVNGATMYCLFAPCRPCCNMIRNAGITTVIYKLEYDGFPESADYLAGMGILVERYVESGKAT